MPWIGDQDSLEVADCHREVVILQKQRRVFLRAPCAQRCRIVALPESHVRSSLPGRDAPSLQLRSSRCLKMCLYKCITASADCVRFDDGQCRLYGEDSARFRQELRERGNLGSCL